MVWTRWGVLCVMSARHEAGDVRGAMRREVLGIKDATRSSVQLAREPEDQGSAGKGVPEGGQKEGIPRPASTPPLGVLNTHTRLALFPPVR